MHYLITGHTGFKGAWLSMLLLGQGHNVSGLALDPLPNSLFERAGLADRLVHDIRADIRNQQAVAEAVAEIQPEVVVHLAAQPLVRASYLDPRYTFETNVNGTLNVLEATNAAPSTLARLIVTTDKVYRNTNRRLGYREDEPLGGDDPYSSSKAMADILTHSWVSSFPGVPTAVARAGNVIGGGDVSPDRLVPDLLSGFADDRSVALRYPNSVRPWQHVLDCLNGYSTIIDHLLQPTALPHIAWNIGPDESSLVSVTELAERAAALWGGQARWHAQPGVHPHEAGLLALDATAARQLLAWRDLLTFDEAVGWTVAWEQEFRLGRSARELCDEQLSAFNARKGK